ncbi:protoporphyrinogen oxidase HemJ [Biformimicrobium ophioploci]|uniref:Protoporphyrinogen IX oxidase n=1 Tax=Biformimicrobium ophioploci TaxID=3036711 RepID=A0ABQ6LUB9_9GAMM|nr:protoporphyrinogen oxidase HemJ [Microbulbifer sp. NKW57]GMG85688.1 protoporphyrinogen oxidase HemJ [Microbulbifer sp. NKW57]
MLWVKAFHIIAMVAWFAALFYLPRLFIYHCDATDATSRDRFKIMERRLYRAIANPAMMATILFGIWAASYNWEYYKSAGWFHVKMALVVLLLIFHMMCKKYMRDFAEDNNQKSQRYFRFFNEFPTLILIAAVILVVVRPF